MRQPAALTSQVPPWNEEPSGLYTFTEICVTELGVIEILVSEIPMLSPEIPEKVYRASSPGPAVSTATFDPVVETEPVRLGCTSACIDAVAGYSGVISIVYAPAMGAGPWERTVAGSRSKLIADVIVIASIPRPVGSLMETVYGVAAGVAAMPLTLMLR